MRLLAVGAMLASLALAAVHGAGFLSFGYASIADRLLDRPAAERTLVAARMGSRLVPWSSRRSAVLGWIQAERGAAEPAIAAYGRALRWAPADALLWSEFAQASGRIEAWRAMELGVRRANALAPASPVIHAAHAALAASYWDEGSASLQAEWLGNLRYELDRNRTLFLEAVFARGQAMRFCRGPGLHGLRVGRWCTQLTLRAERCRLAAEPGTELELCMPSAAP